MNLGDKFPNFTADTSKGVIKLYEWMGDSWAILISHPADFTPVCTTELGQVAKLAPEFEKRNTKLIALSCDSVACHRSWIDDIKHFSCLEAEGFPFPIIADEKRELAVKLGMLDPDEKDSEGMPLTCRAVYVIGPEKTLKLSMLYPATTGRNFEEVLRALDALQLSYYTKVATPAGWKRGDDCMVLPEVKDEEVLKLFPKGVRVREVPSGKKYIRFTPQPI